MKRLLRPWTRALAGLAAVLLAAACQGAEPTALPTAPPPAVTGTITYGEDVDLRPGSELEVELRDVSLIDGPSEVIARQVVPVQGRGPFPFRLEYYEADIRPGNAYAVQARISHSDGSLAFITDTAYEVISQGRPGSVDLVLVMAAPPPSAVPTVVPPLPGEWVALPAPIRKVEIEEYDEGYLLTATYSLPGGEDCARFKGLTAELVGANFYILVNNLEKRDEDGSPACASPPREEEVEIPMEGPFTPGEVYRVRVNERLTNSFTPPPAEYESPEIVPSPIEETELEILEKFPPVYQVRVVSGLPLGSSCSAFNGYAIERAETGRIVVQVTHHETREANVVCTEDYPMVETVVPLGEDFEPGREYAIDVNGGTLTFRAQ